MHESRWIGVRNILGGMVIKSSRAFLGQYLLSKFQGFFIFFSLFFFFSFTIASSAGVFTLVVPSLDTKVCLLVPQTTHLPTNFFRPVVVISNFSETEFVLSRHFTQ